MFYILKKYFKLKQSLQVKNFMQINQINSQIGNIIRGKTISNDFIIQNVNILRTKQTNEI